MNLMTLPRVKNYSEQRELRHLQSVVNMTTFDVLWDEFWKPNDEKVTLSKRQNAGVDMIYEELLTTNYRI